MGPRDPAWAPAPQRGASCMDVCMYMYIYIYIYTHTHYTFLSLLYIYIYICIYTYIYIYIYIYICHWFVVVVLFPKGGPKGHQSETEGGLVMRVPFFVLAHWFWSDQGFYRPPHCASRMWCCRSSICRYICIYIYIYTDIRISLSIYIYIYICIYMYIHMHILSCSWNRPGVV